jgi:TRAP-type transport system small permease protein
MGRNNILKKLSDFVYELGKYITLSYTLIVLIVVLASVLLRMIGKAPSWTEELARWLLVGVGFVGASVALKEGAHVGITIIIKSIKPVLLKKILIIFSHLAALFFLLYLTYSGFDAAIRARAQMGDVLKIPMMYTKLNIALGALFMVIHVIYIISITFKSNNLDEVLLSKQFVREQ